ncbi:MAG: hypothetical protein ACI8S6_004925 [Myxococcota bacterium]|jgi:hypothetical protein
MLLLLCTLALAAPEEDEQLAEGIDVSRQAQAPVSQPPVWRLGGSLGLGLPMDGTSVMPVLGASGSWAVPAWDRRIRPTVTAAGARTCATGTISDPRLPDELAHQTCLLAALLGLGVEVALLPGAVSPHLAVTPALSLSQTVGGGTVGGSELRALRERRASLGWLVSGGVSVEKGPGELTGGITYLRLQPGGVMAGEARTRSITPTVGYRMAIAGRGAP